MAIHKEDIIYLIHILQCIEKIEQYTLNKSLADFYQSSLLQDGVIRQLEIIGEATKHLSKEITVVYLSIDWKDIAGMHDKLIHNYFGVDAEVVWQTVIEDIPPLKEEIMKIIGK